MNRKILIPLLCLYFVVPDADAQDSGDASGVTIVARSLHPNDPSPNLVRYGITREDVRRIETLLPHIRSLVPIRDHPETAIRAQGNEVSSPIRGTIADYIRFSELKIIRGRFLTKVDDAGRSNVAVISEKHATRLFPRQDPIGRAIRIDKEVFTVVGVANSAIEPLVYIPLMTMRTRFGDKVMLRKSGSFEARYYELSELWIQLDSEADFSKSLQTATAIVQKYHDQADFEIRLK